MSCSESTSSCQSLAHGSTPEILVGLLYNATTGRLSVEVIKGSHFKNLAVNRPPSEYKTCLEFSNDECVLCKLKVYTTFFLKLIEVVQALRWSPN